LLNDLHAQIVEVNFRYAFRESEPQRVFSIRKPKAMSGSVISLILVLVTSMLIPLNSADAATQKVNFYINGDCLDYYEMEGEYAFFEEEPDWSCYLTVKISPVKPIRNSRLQYWNGKKWLQESFKKTSSKGFAYLDFNPYCDGEYCDGTWKYRIVVDAGSGQSSRTSPTFEVSFYPGYVEDYSEEEDGY